MTAGGGRPLRVGLTLPAFQPDPAVAVDVARAAEDAGLDGVFVFDHLFRLPVDGGPPRQALEGMTMMAAVAAATRRVAVGVLVARASMRPPAVLVSILDTLARIAPGRIVAGLGAGDALSDAEDRAFGTERSESAAGGVAPDRIARLTETVARAENRGYPVWVGGLSPAVRRLAAARADGWNAWGLTVDRFAEGVAAVRHEVVAAGRDPEVFECSWGGLAVLGGDGAEAAAKLGRLGGDRPGLVTGGPAEVAPQLAAYRDAGAAWVIVGPIDSSRPDNATHLAAARARLTDVGA